MESGQHQDAGRGCPSEGVNAPCVWQLLFLVTAGAVSGKGGGKTMLQ